MVSGWLQNKLVALMIGGTGCYWVYTQVQSYRAFAKWKSELRSLGNQQTMEEIDALLLQVVADSDRSSLLYSAVQHTSKYRQYNDRLSPAQQQQQQQGKALADDDNDSEEDDRQEKRLSIIKLNEVLPSECHITGEVRFTHRLSRAAELIPSVGSFLRQRKFFQAAKESENTLPLAVRAREFAVVPVYPTPVWHVSVEAPLQCLWPGQRTPESSTVVADGTLRILDRDAPLPPSIQYQLLQEIELEAEQQQQQQQQQQTTTEQLNAEQQTGEQATAEQPQDHIEQVEDPLKALQKDYRDELVIKNIVFQVQWHRVEIDGNVVFDSPPVSDAHLSPFSYRSPFHSSSFRFSGLPVDVFPSTLPLSTPTAFYYFL